MPGRGAHAVRMIKFAPLYGTTKSIIVTLFETLRAAQKTEAQTIITHRRPRRVTPTRRTQRL